MTETKTLTPQTTDDRQPEPKPRLLDLSATQLTGGALAAMTSAVIGAQIGVAGTVIGAAVGSLVAGVAGSLYTASLQHTKDRLQSAIVGKVGGTTVEVEQVPDWGDWADQTVTLPAAVAPPSAAPVAAAVPTPAADRAGGRLPWKPILATSAAVFALAVAGITGFELASGQSISGGEGTTITQVSEGRSGGSHTPTQAPSSTPSAESTAVPSATPSAEPSTSAEPSAEPSTEPSESATAPSATPEPSTSSGPGSSADPSQGGASASAQAGGLTGGGSGG